MTTYSLKKFLLEGEETTMKRNKSNSISRLVCGMKKSKTLNENISAPITPKASGWEHLIDPNRLRRKFTIESFLSKRKFIDDVLVLADHAMHHIEINILFDDITIEIYTSELNDLTELDFEYAKDIEEIYVDSLFSFGENQEENFGI